MSGALAGRVALVTGAGRGLGMAIASALAEAGAATALVARTAGEIESVAADLRATGREARAFPCDVTDEAAVADLAARVPAALGPVDILVNNAGVGASAPLERITLAEWNRLMTGNATSAFLCLRAFLPGMKTRGWGRVVTVASRAGLEGARYVAHYCAAKHAVVGLTRAAALEAGDGVAVNAVCPGYVDTPMTAATLANVVARTGATLAEALERVLATTGQARLLTAQEVAAAVVALCLPGTTANGAAVPLPNGDRP